MSEGICLGGPAAGKVVQSNARLLVIPVHGEKGFSAAYYEWNEFAGAWIYQEGKRK